MKKNKEDFWITIFGRKWHFKNWKEFIDTLKEIIKKDNEREHSLKIIKNKCGQSALHMID